jgi:hypothetical protein
MLPRLGLRALMVLVLGFGFGFRFVAHLAHLARVQRHAVAAVEKVGGSVIYDWQFDGGKFRLTKGTNFISKSPTTGCRT